MLYFYLTQRKDGTLAVAEAEAARLGDGSVVAPGLIKGSSAYDPSDSGYTRYGAGLIARGSTVEEICGQVRDMGLEADGFRIVVERIPGKLRVNRRRCEMALADSIKGSPNLREPAVEFLLVVTEQEAWFGRMLEQGERRWERFRHKPYPYCHALPVELAVAVVNLSAAAGDVVFDPCCGSGTVPLVAAERGMHSLGCDINRQVSYHALRNARHFGHNIEIWHGDGCETDRKADCIITNLAYDRRCPITAETVRHLLANFRNLAERITVVTAQDIRDIVSDLGYALESRLPASTHSITRWIYEMRASQ